MNNGFLRNKNKKECCGCEACVQICPKQAVRMEEDLEGFRYPVVDEGKCVHCGLCHHVCQYEQVVRLNSEKQFVFGGYSENAEIRAESTSGGAFSEIVDVFCDDNYEIFGVTCNGLKVYHTHIDDKSYLGIFRKSKYLQSEIGNSFNNCKNFLLQGKKVIFSGTPCQIAGLDIFLKDIPKENLLTVEVVCESVPSPLYVNKMDKYFTKEYGAPIRSLDYRYKVIKKRKSLENPISGKWDFQVMHTSLQNHKSILLDRWFNPFWSIWLSHLMSRPCCYNCRYAQRQRIADITLGDLWGVHLYCPDLYGRNGGSSLIICNTEKGYHVFKKAQNKFFGRELRLDIALKYQGPLRNSIPYNQDRERFMCDLCSSMEFQEINKKWAKKPSLKLLYQKYIWGNRQKIAWWNFKEKIKSFIGRGSSFNQV